MTDKRMYIIPPEITVPGVRFESGLCRNRSCATTVRITQRQRETGGLSSQCVACRDARRVAEHLKAPVGTFR